MTKHLITAVLALMVLTACNTIRTDLSKTDTSQVEPVASVSLTELKRTYQGNRTINTY